MGTDLSRINIITRREIEARIAGPLLSAFIEEFGRERTLDIAEAAIKNLAQEAGKQLAAALESNTLADFARGMEAWKTGDALDIDVLEQTEHRFEFNVVRCGYAAIYKELGLADQGYVLSCGRDFALVEGFNPKIRLCRTQTIMEGAEHCDFRFSME